MSMDEYGVRTNTHTVFFHPKYCSLTKVVNANYWHYRRNENACWRLILDGISCGGDIMGSFCWYPLPLRSPFITIGTEESAPQYSSM